MKNFYLVSGIALLLIVVFILGGFVSTCCHSVVSGWGALLGAFISTFITCSVMWFIDKQSKQRWQKDSFEKYKNQKVLELYNILNHFCIRTDETGNTDADSLRELKSMPEEIRLVLKGFLTESEIALLFSETLLIEMMTMESEMIRNVGYNHEKFSKIVKIRDNLRNKLFE